MYRPGSGFLQSIHSGYGIKHDKWLGCGTYNPQLRPVCVGMNGENVSNVSQSANPSEVIPQKACLPATDLLGNPVIFQQVEMDSNQAWMPIGSSLNSLKNIVTLSTAISVATPGGRQIINPLPRPITSSQDESGHTRNSRTQTTATQIEDPNQDQDQETSLSACVAVKQTQTTPEGDDDGSLNLSKAGEIDEGPIIHVSVEDTDHAHTPGSSEEASAPPSPIDHPAGSQAANSSFDSTEHLTDSATNGTAVDEFHLPLDVTKLTSQLTASCHSAIQSIDPDTEMERGFGEHAVEDCSSPCDMTMHSFQSPEFETDRHFSELFQMEADTTFECYVDEWLNSLKNLSFISLSEECLDSTTKPGMSKTDDCNIPSIETVHSELPLDIRQFICEITPSSDVTTPSIYPDIEIETASEKQLFSETVSNNLQTTYDRTLSINLPGLETCTETMKPCQSFESYSNEVINEFQKESHENTAEDCQMILEGIRKLKNCKIDEFLSEEATDVNKRGMPDISITYVVDPAVSVDKCSLVQICDITVPLEESSTHTAGDEPPDSARISIDIVGNSTILDNLETVLEITAFTSDSEALPDSVRSEIVLDLDEATATYDMDSASSSTDTTAPGLPFKSYQIDDNLISDLNALLYEFIHGMSISTSKVHTIFRKIVQLIPSLTNKTSGAVVVKPKHSEPVRTHGEHKAAITPAEDSHPVHCWKNNTQDRRNIERLLEEISKTPKPLVVHRDWNSAGRVGVRQDTTRG